MSEHTPLPWEVVPVARPRRVRLPVSHYIEAIDGDKGVILAALIQDQFPETKMAEANAEFIVRACNAHYDLLEACKLALESYRIASEHHNIEFDAIPIEDAIKKATK